MASLAGLLKKKGYEVAGSDQDIYPPMSDMLNDLKIPVYSPYSANNIKKFHMKPRDMFVVGNAIGRGNSELEYILSNGLPYRSMSDILLEEFIEDKKPIVITGTHGKTTTTALIAWILECAGLDPTVFVGGLAKNFNSSFKLGKGEYVVLEGDEYDTAFFDKGPKFWHYRPFIGLINNIEWDHVDIYKDFEAYRFAFKRFAKLIPENGLLAVSHETKLKEFKELKNVKTYGVRNGNYSASNISFGDEKMTFHVKQNGKQLFKVETVLFGKYNISNILGAIVIARFLGVSHETLGRAISSFKGVKRRAEIIGEKNGITVIDDYAHHPTAVRETLRALKLNYGVKPANSAGKHKNRAGRRIIAIFEPGSASSKRRLFEHDYINAFLSSDLVFLYKPFKPGKLKTVQMFHGKHVASALNKRGLSAMAFDDINNLLFHVKQEAKRGDIIVIMSCRGFDGLYKLIWDVL